MKNILTTVAYAIQVPTRRPIAAPPFVKYKLNYIPTCQIIFLLVRSPTDTRSGNLAIFILFLLLFDLNFQRLDFLHQIWQEESYLGDLQCQAGQAPRPTHQQMCSTRRTLKEHCVFIFVSALFFGICLCRWICAYFPPGCRGRCRW